MEKKIFCLLLCLALLLFAGCARGGSDEGTDTQSGTQTEINYENINVWDYVSDVSYKALGLTLTGDNEKDAQAIWDAVLASAEISEYPEDKVEYYFNQTKASYLYTVDYDFDAYELLLEKMGIDEDDMYAEACELVKKDLVFKAIAEREGIALTEQERAESFDKYADKLASELGVTSEYVASKMSDYVYETMLYDKTTQALIEMNR